MGRDLVVCCDGTWNDAPRAEQSERSNVWRFYELALGVPGETRQYFHGVGTRDLKDWLRGGLWGFGIGKAIREAFGWLAQHYAPGDRIFLIGFSRGAFTARSLAGMIGYRGLNPDLAKLDEQQLEEAVAREYGAYRARTRTTEPVPNVHFVGVFDTVGKLGVPNQRKIANLFDRPKAWAFHDTQLGAHVTHGRHAIAIDESRAEFMPTLWVSSKGEPIYDFAANGRSVKQLWFCGQHSDVGGANRPVANMALSWMLQEAQSCGLAVDQKALAGLALNPLAPLSPTPRGLFVFMPRGVPLLTRCNKDRVVHPSVLARRKQDGAYWPLRWLRPEGAICAVESKKGTSWQETGIWIANGRSFIAKTKQKYGTRGVKGYVANGGNPAIDGTWPEHESFDINKRVTIKRGGGYIYFRILRKASVSSHEQEASAWQRLKIEIVPA